MSERLIAGKLLMPLSSFREGCSEDEPQRLIESAELALLKETYCASDRSFDDMMQAAAGVGELVRQTLQFSSMSALSRTLTAENLAEVGSTNCYGHALVASELLEEIGVEHFIGYANQHVFVLLFDRKSDRSYLLDPATRELCVESTLAIGGPDPINQLMKGELRAVNSLVTTVLLKKLPSTIDPVRFLQSRPWMSFTKDHGISRSVERSTDELLQLLIYPSIPGRELLHEEYNLLLHYLREEMVAAARILSELGGIYPDVDARNKLRIAEKMAKQVMRRGEHQLALDMAGAVDVSIASPRAGRFDLGWLFLPDVMRDVAVATGDSELMERTMNHYRGLPQIDLVKGKQQKAWRQLANMHVRQRASQEEEKSRT